MGTRLPRCSSPSFAEKVKDAIPLEVREALLPLVQLVKTVNECIERYDQKIEELGRKKYGHTTLLRQVKGVGPRFCPVFCVNDQALFLGLQLFLGLRLFLGMGCKGRGHFPFPCVST